LKFYWDTSFLLSLHAVDVNSPAAIRFPRRRKGDVVLTPLFELEFVTGLNARCFGASWRNPRSTRSSAHSSPIGRVVFTRFFFCQRACLRKHFQLARKFSTSQAVRSLDLLHVASALHAAVVCCVRLTRGRANSRRPQDCACRISASPAAPQSEAPGSSDCRD